MSPTLPLPLATLSLLIVACLPGHAQAVHQEEEPQNTLNLFAATSIQRDSNLLRLPGNPANPATLGISGRNDITRSTQFGLQFDKPYSLQRFRLDASHTDNRHNTFRFLDHTATNYLADWAWQLTPYLNGHLTKDRNQKLINYADYNGSYSSANVRTTESYRFNLNAEPISGWQVIVTANRNRQSNTLYFETDGNHTINEGETGLRYQRPNGNAITLVTRTGKARYTDRPSNPRTLIDNRFKQTQQELQVDWNISAKSRMNARLGYLERKHTHYPARDYSGVTGQLQYTLHHSEKLSLALQTNRTLNSYQTLTESWYTNRTLSLAPSWSITPTLHMSAQILNAQRDFHGSLTNLATTRTDHIRTRNLVLRWTPTPYLSLDTSLGKERRTSNRSNNDYTSNNSALSLIITF